MLLGSKKVFKKTNFLQQTGPLYLICSRSYDFVRKVSWVRHSVFARNCSAKVDTAFSHENAVLRSNTAFSREIAVLRSDTAFSREIAVLRSDTAFSHEIAVMGSSLHFCTKMLCCGPTQRFCTTQHSYCNISCTKRSEGQPWGGPPYTLS